MRSKWLRPAPKPRKASPSSSDDTALRSLTHEERRRISMDSWEPSLLRNLLSAEGRLKKPR